MSTDDTELPRSGKFWASDDKYTPIVIGDFRIWEYPVSAGLDGSDALTSGLTTVPTGWISRFVAD